MKVKELIEKLKTCDPDAIMCWDSNSVDYWFGNYVDEENMLIDEMDFEDGLPPSLNGLAGDSVSLVVLR